tara:strand:+ start:58 stop:264 length:207 start_codon:yes stop_codon:yes gene_type:complete
MSKDKNTKLSTKKVQKKNCQLVMRLNNEVRDEFVLLCEELDTSASRELRRFIREFIAEHQETHENSAK